MKKPALKKEDGAEFFAKIEALENGEIRASCYAQIDHGHSMETEEPNYMMSESIDAALKWTDEQAFRRRFTNYLLTSPVNKAQARAAAKSQPRNRTAADIVP